MLRGLLEKLRESNYESKLLRDFQYIFYIIRYVNNLVPSFLKIGMGTIFVVFIARGFINGIMIPYSISYVVEGLSSRERDMSLFYKALYMFAAAGVIFGVTEIAQMIYFKRLTRSIVKLKLIMLGRISREKSLGEDEIDNIVGKIANDVDFIVWNINGVITTLLPNLFTSTLSVVAVYTFNTMIGVSVLITLLPYIVYAEFYSRNIEKPRVDERTYYAKSIVYIKRLVFGERVNGDISNVLSEWNRSVDKILWLDRVYWTLSLSTASLSMIYVSLLSWREVNENRLSLGSLAGLLSAALGSHFSMINAVWALCVQGQTVATIKRVIRELEVVTRR
ncbi:MAG: hypothetical protein ABWJ42_03200 [Sulfolobales archaeon]